MYVEPSDQQKKVKQVYESLKDAMETLYQLTYDEYDRSEVIALENIAEKIEEIMESVSTYINEISPEDIADDYLYGRL